MTDRIPVGGWRERAACAGYDPTLWDNRLPGEPDVARLARHDQARAICTRECPVRAACAADVDWRADDGVRGGHVLPSLDSHVRGKLSDRDRELRRLLQAGVGLDQAAVLADAHRGKPGRPRRSAA